MILKRNMLFLFVLLLCNAVPVQAGIISWFTERLFKSSQTTERHEISRESLENRQENRPQRAMGLWERFKYYCLWITPEDLKKSEDAQKNEIDRQFKKVKAHVDENIHGEGGIKEKVTSAKIKVTKVKEDLGDVRKELTKKNEENMSKLQELKGEQERTFEELDKEAEQQKDEQLRKLEEHKKIIQEKIAQKKKELEALESQLDGEEGVRKQFEAHCEASRKQFEETGKDHRRQTAEVRQKIKVTGSIVGEIGTSAKRTSEQLASLKSNLPEVRQKFQRMQEAHLRQQELLDRLLEKCSGITQDHEYLMQLMLGLNQKFGLVLQLVVLRTEGESVPVKQLEHMQRQYKALLASIGLVQEKRKRELSDSTGERSMALTLLPNGSRQTIIIDQDMMHKYQSSILRTNRMSFPKRVLEDPEETTLSLVKKKPLRGAFSLYNGFMPIFLGSHSMSGNDNEFVQWPLIALGVAQYARKPGGKLMLTNGETHL